MTTAVRDQSVAAPAVVPLVDDDAAARQEQVRQEQLEIAAARSAEPAPRQICADRLYTSFGLSHDEYAMIRARLGRLPNYVEVGMYSVLWSEHCSYKSSRRVLARFPTDGPQVLQGPGENAGVVDIGEGLAVAFKVESHNHPTAVEPYEGAATGVGGIVRDVFTMGARPIALLNSLRFGEIDGSSDRNRYLFGQAVAGIAAYGNCIGVPTVGGEAAFDERYARNPLVNAMCVGLLRHEDVATGSASGVGNPVLAVGARTGRDGIHGATFASVEDPRAEARSAVQVGDPFLEKLLLEACLELIGTGEVVGIQDMGAAGLASSSAEMAARAGAGIELDLLAVPRRETGMTPYELMLSESQERMLVVMRAGREQVASEIFAKWGLEAAVVGRVTDDGLLRLRQGDEVVAELPVSSLVDEAPAYHRPAARPAYLAVTGSLEVAAVPACHDPLGALLQLLSSPTISSKRWIYRQYDHMVRTATVVTPGSDAAVVAIDGTQRAIAISTDCNGRWVYLDPRRGGQHAVAEAARNVVCSGARPLAVSDCLNYGSPEDPEVFWQFEQSCAGVADACRALGTPVVSGNVSFYNQSDGVDIYPTPVIGMVGVVEDIAHVTTQHLKRQGSRLVALGPVSGTTLHGSEYLRVAHGEVAGTCPPLDLDTERAVQAAVLEAIRAGLVLSAHDVSDGGLAVAVAEMAIGGGLGVHLALDATYPGQASRRLDEVLFGEAGSIVVLEVAPHELAAVARVAAAHGVQLTPLGAVGGDRLRLEVDGDVAVDADVQQVALAWQEAIECAMS